jgi:hypothetical protein
VLLFDELSASVGITLTLFEHFYYNRADDLTLN